MSALTCAAVPSCASVSTMYHYRHAAKAGDAFADYHHPHVDQQLTTLDSIGVYKVLITCFRCHA